MSEEKLERGLRWLAQAEADLDAAAYNLKGERFYLVCFLAQQSAEKAIKAYLYARGEERVTGHAVSELIARARGAFEPVGEDAAALDAYYLPSRYPDVHPAGSAARHYTSKEARQAVDMAGEVISHCERESLEA